MNKYSINNNYFEKIDSYDKAYFLGWLYSDGNMAKNETTVSIVLQEKDVKILKKMAKKISSDIKLVYINRKSDKDTNNRQNQYRLQLTRSKIYSDLQNLGMYPQKSNSIGFPSPEVVPEQFIFDFIRGYFDGDGCLCLEKEIENQKTPKYQVLISCSTNFALGIQKYLAKYDIKSFFLKTKSKDIVSWKISGKLNSLKFLYLIYQNRKDLYLDRKYKKFQLILTKTLNRKCKLPTKTRVFLEKYNFFRLFLNKEINYSSHWHNYKRNNDLQLTED